MKTKSLILLFWIGLSCLCISAQTPERLGFHFDEAVKSVRIPFELYHNLILVKLHIDDSPELTFILDTGVDSPILIGHKNFTISPEKINRTIQITGLGEGDIIEAKVAHNTEIKLQGITGTKMNMIILPTNVFDPSASFGRPIHGIIGFSLFSRFVTEINYDREFIRLYRSDKFKPPLVSIIKPLEIINTKPYIEIAMPDSTGQMRPIKAMVDTGASNALTLFGKPKDFDLNIPCINTFIGSGLSGDLLGELGILKKIELDRFNLKKVIATFPDSSSMKFLDRAHQSGNIGGEILKRFNVTFDYRHNKLYLKKNRHFYKPFSYNISGIELEAFGENYDQFKIFYVRESSLVKDADIQAGDIIKSINGHKPKDTDIGKLYNMLNAKPNRNIKLKLERNQEIIKRKFFLKDPLEALE